jgi:hypothetical protein
MKISLMISRMKRLPRHHRIAHLRSVISTLPPRSIRRDELEVLLRDEVTAQLRKENRAA